MDNYNPVYPGLYYFDTFTFTTLGTSGHRGPESTKTYANAPWREGDFSIVDGQQQWTVPTTGTYRIEAAGAYGATPGRVVSGDVDLNEGQVVSLLVGQQPNPLVSNVVDNVTVGGGGGTFVTVGGKPLIVASGGDGGVYSTGYLRTELVIPNTIQTSVSMSADGTVMVALNLDIITFVYEYAVYRYSSGVWNFETSFPVVGSEKFPTISGNGNTILLFSSQNIRVFEYIDSEWTGPNLITDVTTWYSQGNRSFNISYDGYTVILTVPSAVSYDQIVYVCTKNQDLTWNSLIQIQPAVEVNENYFRNGSTYVAISGDGTSICVNTESRSYPYTQKSWVYTRTGESTWSSPVLLSSGLEPFSQIDMSYDGQTIALLLADPNIATIWLRVYTNGTLSKDITLPFPQTNYLPGIIKLSYDGSLLLFAQYFNVTLYTTDSQITVSDTVNEFPFAAASMDSTGNRVVNSAISLTNPITYFFEAGGSGQPGSFLPSGTGSGISGAGYLTDGQVSNPYFGFLKPQAYVDGGFGNMYWYGHKGKGGFGGGQSPLNLQTSLTSIIGYKQVRPSIPVNGVRQMNSIALSDDGNTFLASGQRQTGTPLNFTNVYTYIDSSWTNTNISDELSYVSTSADGSVWLINGDVWRNGSFETTLDTIGSYSRIPGEPRSCISSDGNTAVVLSASYGEFIIPYALNVYTYSGSWNSTNLPISPEVPNDIYALQCAISGDGSTIVLKLSGYINYPNFFTFVDVYTKVGETWSTPNRIFTNTSITSGTLGINSNGSEIVFARSIQNYVLYSNGTITSFPSIEGISFSRTNPYFYVYSVGNKIYAPSISLDVTVSINDKNSYIASGSNIVATTDSSSPSAFVFVDMYDPTTTCTANTAVDHGYPHNYQIQITGTSSFNGTWDIVTTSSNTFTFQAFGGPTETAGYVSGTTTGISGGGGYTGSSGDGVSGATCYADPTVANFTDLGATSNTAGTVTISLIDPVPLKQTWTWDQTYTNTSPKVPVDVISWSDKRGIFESLTGSSTDGIHWDGATVYDLVKGQVSPSTFYSAYSDTLNLYIGFQFSIVNQNDVIVYVTSNDGITWTETTPIGLDILEVFGRFLWSSELNLFVIAGYGSIGSSYDGINWTERYSYPGAYFNVNSIAYSYSIHTFVCTADWDVIDNVDMGLYSTDGITWNTWSVTVSPQPTSLFRGVSVTWSPKLNIFIASVTYDALYSNIARSADGQTWTTSGSNDPDAELGWIVLWGEGLDVCTALSQPPGYTMYSYDAINWSVLFTSVTANHLAYSPSLKIFVPVEQAGFIQFISIDGIYYVNIAGFYPGTLELSFTWAPQIGTFAGQRYGGCISNNGVNWEETFTTYSDVCEWSPELGLYIALTFNNQIGPYLHSYYSSDGKTWTYTGGLIAEPTLPFDQLFVKPFVSWSPTLGVFSGAYYSRDGINWIQSLPDSSATAVGWSSFHGMFVAFHYTDVYYSYDGTTWTTGTNNTGVSGFGKIACSSSGRFVCQAGTIIPGIPFESSDEYVPQGVLYSDDGINWISPGVEFSLIAPIWVEELSIFVARANLFEDNDPTGWISSDGITWSAINIQALSWSPELGRFLCPGGYSQVNNTF